MEEVDVPRLLRRLRESVLRHANVNVADANSVALRGQCNRSKSNDRSIDRFAHLSEAAAAVNRRRWQQQHQQQCHQQELHIWSSIDSNRGVNTSISASASGVGQDHGEGTCPLLNFFEFVLSLSKL